MKYLLGIINMLAIDNVHITSLMGRFNFCIF